MNILKTTISVLALSAIAGSAAAADFATLDANADGQVDFPEYQAHALKEGKTVTLAAQEFTRIAQGDAIVTQDEMLMAEAFVDQPYALQNPTAIPEPAFEPLPYDPVEDVNAVETFESFPQAVEAIEPPVVEEAPKPITSESDTMDSGENTDWDVVPAPDAPVDSMTQTPLDNESAVAGELEIAPTDRTEIETPIEEDESDMLDNDALEDPEAPTLEEGDIY